MAVEGQVFDLKVATAIGPWSGGMHPGLIVSQTMIVGKDSPVVVERRLCLAGWQVAEHQVNAAFVERDHAADAIAGRSMGGAKRLGGQVRGGQFDRALTRTSDPSPHDGHFTTKFPGITFNVSPIDGTRSPRATMESGSWKPHSQWQCAWVRSHSVQGFSGRVFMASRSTC